MLNLPGEPKAGTVNRSPFRRDKKPSFSIRKTDLLWKDFTTGEGGSAVDFLMVALQLNKKEAMERLIEMAGGEDIEVTNYRQRPRPVDKRVLPILPAMHVGSPDQVTSLSQLRGISEEALDLAIERNILRFYEQDGVEYWVVMSPNKLNAQRRRLDGQLMDGMKGKTFQDAWAKWPIGVPTNAPNLLFCEGGPDILAAHQLILDRSDYGIVGMLGAGMEIHSAALPLFNGKRVTIVAHNDQNEAGIKAAEKWRKQLSAYCHVEIYLCPAKYGDLNEWIIQATNLPQIIQ